MAAVEGGTAGEPRVSGSCGASWFIGRHFPFRLSEVRRSQRVLGRGMTHPVYDWGFSELCCKCPEGEQARTRKLEGPGFESVSVARSVRSGCWMR